MWPGGPAAPIDDGQVEVDDSGLVTYVGVRRPAAGLVLAGGWVGPALVDTHVHLAFGEPGLALRGGVGAVRDLGAPIEDARRWRDAAGGPVVAIAGPIVTSVGGYPAYAWGPGGYAQFAGSPDDARTAVAGLVAAGVDVVKLALQPAPGHPAPSAEVAAAVVGAAHEAGLAVTAHALSVAMVERALDAGVDELAHVPVDLLPVALVRRIADAGAVVSSSLLTHSDTGHTLANAAALVAAGARLVYGTDLGNVGTRPGAEPRELELLAAAGLGRWGALRAATDLAASVAGLAGRVPGRGRLLVGQPASAVLLPGDPVLDPAVWRTPTAVVQGVLVLQ